MFQVTCVISKEGFICLCDCTLLAAFIFSAHLSGTLQHDWEVDHMCLRVLGYELRITLDVVRVRVRLLDVKHSSGKPLKHHSQKQKCYHLISKIDAAKTKQVNTLKLESQNQRIHKYFCSFRTGWGKVVSCAAIAQAFDNLLGN